MKATTAAKLSALTQRPRSSPPDANSEEERRPPTEIPLRETANPVEKPVQCIFPTTIVAENVNSKEENTDENKKSPESPSHINKQTSTNVDPPPTLAEKQRMSSPPESIASTTNHPLARIRSAQQTLRRVAAQCQLHQNEIREKLAKAAADELASVEAEIRRLERQKSSALIHADQKMAEMLQEEIVALAESVISHIKMDMLSKDLRLNSMDSPSTASTPRSTTASENQRNRISRRHSANTRRSTGKHKQHGALHDEKKLMKRNGNNGRHSRHYRDAHAELKNTPNTTTSDDSDSSDLSDSIQSSAANSLSLPPILKSGISSSASSDAQRRHALFLPEKKKTSRKLKTHQNPLLLEDNNAEDDLHEFKRNQRLFLDKSHDEDYYSADAEVISSAAVCPYCRQRNPGFVNGGFLKQHCADVCTTLCRCEYCDKVIEVSELNNHYLKRCTFVDGSLEMCQRCGLSRPVGQSAHPKCRLDFAPDGGKWCPLCTALIFPNTRETWRQHLADDCYNNHRNQRWPYIGDVDAVDEDTRGDSLLARLSADENQNDNWRRRDSNPQISSGQQLQQQSSSSAIDAAQLRNAMKRLNRDYHRRNRATSSAPVITQRIIHHDDSD